jgi:hypothetical protein
MPDMRKRPRKFKYYLRTAERWGIPDSRESTPVLLPTSLMDRVKQYCAEHGQCPGDFFRAIMSRLCDRYKDQLDIELLGTPVDMVDMARATRRVWTSERWTEEVE